MFYGVRFLLAIILASYFIHSESVAQDGLYDARPSIQDVEPRARRVKRGWKDIKRAMVEYLAMVSELYPEHQLYFVARDGEYLFDLAVILTEKEPSLKRRLHLVNLSRRNIESSQVDDYLEQVGLSDRAIKKSGPVLFVDTGERGTIPVWLRKKLSGASKDLFQVQYIYSSHADFPSARTFLHFIEDGEVDSARMEYSIFFRMVDTVEHLPHFTQRSDTFVKKGKRLVPATSEDAHNYADDFYPEKAVRLMEDLRYFAELESTAELFQKRREAWRKLYRLFYEERYSELEIELERLKNSKDRLERAMRYDFLDIMTKNPPAKLQKVNLKSELKARRSRGGGRCSVYAP